MKTKRVGRLLLGLVLSVAMVVTLIPSLGTPVYAYSGSWSVVDDENDIYCEKEDETVELNAQGQIYIEDESGDDALTLDDFSYKWYQFDEDNDVYYPIVDETSPTYVADALNYGDYRCVINVKGDEEDSNSVYFYVHPYRAQFESASFKGNGVHAVREYTSGYFDQDSIGADYFYRYDPDEDGMDIWFNEGDEITINFDDGSKAVYTYKTVTFTDPEDGSEVTSEGFYDNNGSELEVDLSIIIPNQSFQNPLGVGSKLDAEIILYDYDYYDEEKDDWYCVTVDVKGFAEIVKNPEALFDGNALYYLNEDGKSVTLDTFVNRKVSEFTVPDNVTLGDGQSYPVRVIADYAFAEETLKTLTIPVGVYVINYRAFGWYWVYIQAKGEWDLEKAEGFTLNAKTNSASYEFAKDYGITVVDNDPATNGTALKEAQAEAEKFKADLAAAAAREEALQKELEASNLALAKLNAKDKRTNGLKAKAKKKGKAKISWKKTPGVTGYQIYRSTKKNKGFKKVATITDPNKATWNDKKLKKGKTYYYKIRPYTEVAGTNVAGQLSKAVKIKAKK